MKAAVAGIGYVGHFKCSFIIKKNNEVIALDIDSNKVEQVNKNTHTQCV